MAHSNIYSNCHHSDQSVLVGCLHQPMLKEKQNVQAENCTHPDHFLLGT